MGVDRSLCSRKLCPADISRYKDTNMVLLYNSVYLWAPGIWRRVGNNNNNDNKKEECKIWGRSYSTMSLWASLTPLKEPFLTPPFGMTLTYIPRQVKTMNWAWSRRHSTMSRSCLPQKSDTLTTSKLCCSIRESQVNHAGPIR